MVRKIPVAVFTTGVALACLVAAKADIYSPTQAEFLGLQYVDFINNPNPDNAAVDSIVANGTDGATIQFDTDFDIDDSLWRVAMENASFPHDFTGLDAFSIMFSNPVAPAGVNISAQIFVRSAAGSVFTSSNAVPLSTGGPVTVSFPVSRITTQGGDPADITSFGIEFFGGDEFLGFQDLMATARTAPQPPNLEDHTLYSWEGTLDGWTAGIHPDHAHALSTTGATLGNSSLQITRTVTGNEFPAGSGNITFRWGTQHNLDANVGGAAPQGDYNMDNAVNAADYVVWRKTGINGAAGYTTWRANFGATGGPDPAILQQIADIVNLVNDPDAYSVSFDLTIQDQFPNPNPAWANFHLAIAATDGNPNDGNDAWWQASQFDVDVSTLSTAPVTVTLDFLLSSFDDLGENGIQSLAAVGLDPATQYLTFHLSSNFPATPATYTYYIDNFRIRHIVPDGGLGAGAVPEPGATILIATVMFGIALWRGRGVQNQ